jgi:hypothetical protein
MTTEKNAKDTHATDTHVNATYANDNVIDLGTRERARHNGGLKVGARVQTDAGIVLHQGAAASMECVLDALRDTGLLDGVEGSKVDRAAVGRSRYDQGLWLRQLYFRAGLNTVHAMDITSRGRTGTGEISDEAARARMKYNRTVRDLGVFADAVTNFVCFDHIKRGEQHLNLLRKGLDRLCLVRG